MKIYVIRHGLSEANAEGRIQGRSNCELAPVGVEQARLLGRYFRHEKVQPEVIYSSPLKRAHTTAQLIASQLDTPAPVKTLDSLMEIDVGNLSGKTLEESYRLFPNGWNLDVNKWLDFSLAGGEGFTDFFNRVESAVGDLMEEWRDLLEERTFFFVSHAGVMRPLLRKLLNASGDMMYFTFGNCCHTRIEYRDFNDNVRRVMTDLVRIETVARLMNETCPSMDVEDKVGKKIG